MASDIGSIIADVEAAVLGADAERRRDMLDKVTGLFAEAAPVLKAEQVAAFDAVIIRLTQGAETGVRAELSGRLADISNAPPMVVRELAFDACAEIAGPLLSRSPRLSEDDLRHLAEHRGQGHLLALARRPALTKQVAELLVQRGDRHVVRAVATNESLFFSERAYAVLMRRAGADPVLRDHLEKRSDLAPAHRKRLAVLAEEQGEHALAEAFGTSAQEALIAGYGLLGFRGFSRALVCDSSWRWTDAF